MYRIFCHKQTLPVCVYIYKGKIIKIKIKIVFNKNTFPIYLLIYIFIFNLYFISKNNNQQSWIQTNKFCVCACVCVCLCLLYDEWLFAAIAERWWPCHLIAIIINFSDCVSYLLLIYFNMHFNHHHVISWKLNKLCKEDFVIACSCSCIHY